MQTSNERYPTEKTQPNETESKVYTILIMNLTKLDFIQILFYKRHSRFMGTYVAVNMKSINDDNNLIVHKPAKNMSDLLDDSSKKIMKKAKNKLVLEVRIYLIL